METISLNMFDLGVLLVVGLSGLMSFFRGFVREFISLGSWLVASVVTLRTLPTVSHYIEPQLGSPVVATGIASVGIFFTTLIVISILTGLVLKFIKPSGKMSLLDNLLGLCFGAARGVLMVSIAYYIMGIVLVEKDFPEVIQKAQTRPYIAKTAKLIGSFTPDALNVITPKDGNGGLGHSNALKDSAAKVDKALDGVPSELPEHKSGTSTMPSIEDLKQRLREENQKSE